MLAEDLAWVWTAAAPQLKWALCGFPWNTYLDRDNNSISFLICNFFQKLQSNTLEKFQCLPPKNNTFKQTLTWKIVSLEFILFLRTHSQIFPGLICYHLRKAGKTEAFWLYLLILYLKLYCSDIDKSCISLGTNWRFMERERLNSKIKLILFFYFFCNSSFRLCFIIQWMH